MCHIMDIAKHQLSGVTGFLPEQEPLGRLPNYYLIWEETLDNLTELIKTKKLRIDVERWQCLQLSSSSLTSERHWQRAFVVLSFVGQAYIWMNGVEDTPSRIPKALAKPWWEVSEHLGIPPVASYAAVVLYNWRMIDPSLGITPGNLITLHTYTGTRDEEWFYLVSMFCELAAASGITAALDAFLAMKHKNTAQLIASLSQVAASIKEMTKTLNRMYEQCQPDVFYHAIRPFQSGYTDPGMFPNGGIIFEGVSDSPMRFAGASAAQSSTLPVFDILLGITKTGDGEEFLKQQRSHMPRPHREFLFSLAEQPIMLKGFVAESRDAKLSSTYNKCVHNLTEFRGQHIVLVTRMIVNPASNSRRTSMGGLATRGTGGTNFMVILKNLRDDTVAASHCHDQLTEAHNNV